jgi:hypothetical protein
LYTDTAAANFLALPNDQTEIGQREVYEQLLRGVIYPSARPTTSQLNGITIWESNLRLTRVLHEVYQEYLHNPNDPLSDITSSDTVTAGRPDDTYSSDPSTSIVLALPFDQKVVETRRVHAALLRGVIDPSARPTTSQLNGITIWEWRQSTAKLLYEAYRLSRGDAVSSRGFSYDDRFTDLPQLLNEVHERYRRSL